MYNKNVLAVGEVLYDVIGEVYNLGGAPFNVGAHLAKLGYKSYILSRVGNDQWGENIFAEAKEIGVNTRFLLRHESLPTGTVQVRFEDDEPHYEIKHPVAWDAIEGDLNQLKSIPWSVVTFGSLAQRDEANQRFYVRLFEEIEAEWIYFDCNLRQNFYNKEIIQNSLKLCNIAKFNEDEIRVISSMLYKETLEPADFGARLVEDYGIQIAVYTWGAEGSKAWYENRLYEAAGVDVELITTVGAGDAFSAGFLHRLMMGSDIQNALEKGNLLGAYVASHAGAIPEYSGDLRADMND